MTRGARDVGRILAGAALRLGSAALRRAASRARWTAVLGAPATVESVAEVLAMAILVAWTRGAEDARAGIAALEVLDAQVAELASAVGRGAIDGVLAGIRRVRGLERSPWTVVAAHEHVVASVEPETRRARGVYVTPPSVAAFVVRSTDDLLREAGLVRGLLEPGLGAILDPAVGSGAFPLAILDHARSVGDAGDVARAARRIVACEVLPSARIVARLVVAGVLADAGLEKPRVDIRLGDALEMPWDGAAIAVVVGNPPYARSSLCRGPNARRLLERFRAAVRDEPNVQPLSDDYLKFLALGESLLRDAPVGVLAMVTSATWLHGVLHRGARASLLETFPRADVVELGGGERDENVFSAIRRPVAITVLARGGSLARRVTHATIGGTAREKHAALAARGGRPVRLSPSAPAYFLVPRAEPPPEYSRFVAVADLFSFHHVGAKPGDDDLLVGFEPADLLARLATASSAAKETEARRKLAAFGPLRLDRERVIPYAYRPFDERLTYDEPAIWTRPCKPLRARVDGEPLLLTTRIVRGEAFAHAFVVTRLPDVIFLSSRSSVNAYAFPRSAMVPERLGMGADRELAFAYVYALLSSSAYRERYAAGLAQGFPRIPLPGRRELFRALATEGMALVALHGGPLAPRPVEIRGTDRVVRSASVRWSDRTVHVNASAAIEGVDEEVWAFRVGGHQVLRRWLAARDRRVLADRDLATIGGIVAAIATTIERRRAIDRAIDAHGGFPGAFIPPASASARA